MLEFWSTGALEVYRSTGPLEVYRFYMERLYAGILEHWAFGKCIDSITLLYF